MTWPLWMGGALAGLLLASLAMRWLGEQRWAQQVHTHTGQLEAARAGVHSPAEGRPAAPTRYDTRELEGLPAPVQRYFRQVLQEGQPIIAAAHIEMAGTINLSATAEQWKPFTSHQQVVTPAAGLRPGFLWNARIAMFPGVPARVQDSYIAGQGLVSAKLLGLFTVANAQGGVEMARGEFMRYFAESPWYPTALLPSQGVRWHAVDDTTASATLVDGPITLTMLFRFSPAGLITTVHAESRGAGVGKDMLMLPWECNLSNYQSQDDMLIPMSGEAAWVRPDGHHTYFKGGVTAVRYEYAL
jgi:hypothetical protein